MSETSKTILKNIFLQKRPLGQLIATNKIYRKTKLTIHSGPFKGLKYVNSSSGGAYFPKLLGIYEKELFPAIYEIKEKKFTDILNVGGGEGYYTGGFALMFHEAKLITYEPEFFACYLIDVLSKKNNFKNRLELKAELCTCEKLSAELKKSEKPLVFMDVEGAEHELLNPSKVTGLEKATIIVEIHDTVNPTLGSDIQNWLNKTHNCIEYKQQTRTIDDLTIKTAWKSMVKKSFLKIMDEGRGYSMRWFYFIPKNS